MAEREVKHYMKQQGGEFVVNPISGWDDIELKFPGLKYMSAKGLFDKGEPKNRYIEQHANSDKLRAWIGDPICRKATEIDFVFVFEGESRQSTFESFYNYISTGRVDYWDSRRMKWAKMILLDEFTTKEEKWLGSKPYIELSVKMQNIYGECETYIPDNTPTN